jgi:hypothetical protein
MKGISRQFHDRKSYGYKFMREAPDSGSTLLMTNSYKKQHWKPPNKKKKRGKTLGPPRKRKACHNVIIGLWQNVAEIGPQITMKSSRKTLHEFTLHIPQNTPKRNISSSTNEMLYTDITVIRAQTARVASAHAGEATNCHQNR